MLQKMMEDPLLSNKTYTDSYRMCSSIHYIWKICNIADLICNLAVASK